MPEHPVRNGVRGFQPVVSPTICYLPFVIVCSLSFRDGARRRDGFDRGNLSSTGARLFDALVLYDCRLRSGSGCCATL